MTFPHRSPDARAVCGMIRQRLCTFCRDGDSQIGASWILRRFLVHAGLGVMGELPRGLGRRCSVAWELAPSMVVALNTRASMELT